MERVQELDAITRDRDGKRTLLEKLRKNRLDDFMSGFGTITSKLKEMYQVRKRRFVIGLKSSKKSGLWVIISTSMSAVL